MKKTLTIILALSLTITLFAQQKVAPQRRIQRNSPLIQRTQSGFYGEIFGTYSYVVNEPQTLIPSKGTSGRNEFDLSRATLGYLHSFSREVSSSIAYDASTNYLQEGYIKVNNIIPMVGMSIGMMQTPSSEIVNRIWGYRSLNQSVINRFGYAPEFDAGIQWHVNMDQRGSVYANVMAGNGTGMFSDTDKNKKLYLNVGDWFDRSNVVELYVDYENVGSGKNTITGKITYGLMQPHFSLGVEGFYRMNRKFAGTKDVVPAGGSIFTWFDMARTVRGVIRVDGVDNDLNQAALGVREVYINAGIDYRPASAVHLIPNVVYVTQLKKGGVTIVNADTIIARLTAAVSFSDFR